LSVRQFPPVLAANQAEARPLLVAESYAVRDMDGRPLSRRLSREQAAAAIANGYVEPKGRMCVKYLQLTRSLDRLACMSAGSSTTERLRNAAGQIFAPPRIVKHKAENVDAREIRRESNWPAPGTADPIADIGLVPRFEHGSGRYSPRR
jgi:hypothetical protein